MRLIVLYLLHSGKLKRGLLQLFHNKKILIELYGKNVSWFFLITGLEFCPAKLSMKVEIWNAISK